MRGHKNQITSINFLSQDYVLTSSKDTLLKVWDLGTQHCIETIVAHRSEVWDVAFDVHQMILCTGSNDDEIRVWKVDLDVLKTHLKQEMTTSATMNPKNKNNNNNNNNNEDNDVNMTETETKKGIILKGSLARHSKERIASLKFHTSGRYLVCQSADKIIEIFKVRSAEELKKKLARRKSRKPNATDIEITLQDEISSLQVLRAGSKVQSIDYNPINKNQKQGFQLLVSCTDNSLEVYDACLPVAEEPSKLVTALDMEGHRSHVRALALNADDTMIASGSAGNKPFFFLFFFPPPLFFLFFFFFFFFLFFFF